MIFISNKYWYLSNAYMGILYITFWTLKMCVNTKWKHRVTFFQLNFKGYEQRFLLFIVYTLISRYLAPFFVFNYAWNDMRNISSLMSSNKTTEAQRV